MKLEGRLSGPPETNAKEIAMFNRMIGPIPAETGQQEEKWPLGFVVKGLTVDRWVTAAAVGGSNKDETVLSFLAQVSAMAPVQLYDARRPFVRHFTRIASYRHLPWHKDLSSQIREFNILHSDKLIERVWFRGLSIFTDDGGDC
jgi:hypothetical protein